MEREERAALVAGCFVAVAAAWALFPHWMGAAAGTNREALWSILFTQLVFASGAVAAAAVMRGVPPAATLGWRWTRLGAAGWAAAVVGTLALSNGVHGTLVELHLRHVGSLARVDELARAGAAAEPGLTVLTLALAPALGEELLFRGLVQGVVARRLGVLAGIGISAALFALAHGDLVHGGAALVLGLQLGLVRHRGGSILGPMVCHLANNGVGFLTGAIGLVAPSQGPAGVAASFVVGGACAAFLAATSTSAPEAPGARDAPVGPP